MAASLSDRESSPETEEVEERQEDVAGGVDESKKVDLAARHAERLKRLKDLRLRRVRKASVIGFSCRFWFPLQLKCCCV